MESAVEDIKITVHESRHVSYLTAVEHHLVGQRSQLLHFLRKHCPRSFKVFMAQFGQSGIVIEIIGLQPPVAHADSDERCEHGTHIDKHIKNLKAGITQMRVFRIIIHLADQCLKISFEQTVSESDDRKTYTRNA